MNRHIDIGDLGKYRPVDIWSQMYVGAFKAEMKAFEDYLREAAERREDVRAEKARTKIEDAVKIIEEKILPTKDVERVESKEAQVGYLIWASEQEKAVRVALANQIMDDLLKHKDDPGFADTPAVADIDDWIKAHPQAQRMLLLTQAYPKAERYDVKIDIPAWQTAIEVGIGFIPVVGSIVGGIEVIAGRDIFGNPLSTTDRAIIAAAILLPAVGRIAKLGKGAVTALRISKAYYGPRRGVGCRLPRLHPPHTRFGGLQAPVGRRGGGEGGADCA